ncbi:hypothetical protein K6Q96_10545 [Grimontia kaedaensis]|uniref:Uncharacterized protein n=1 Tax=Grimontia kaedaensis TaxID=2872157 RepID=A0ABY4WQN1_9GAMM|nr:hypothetical protein [Grimontia kaedaensis]USH01360.1 hypothetical protein K6Q96_10545 [Grimontia kaedaensis]
MKLRNLLSIFTLITLTFSLPSISGTVDKTVKDEWEQWGPYKLKTVEIVIGESTKHPKDEISGSRIDLYVVSTDFVTGFNGDAYNSSIGGGGTDTFYYNLGGNESPRYSFSPKKHWLQKIIVKENYLVGESGIQFLRLKGDGFDVKSGTNPGKNYIEKSVVSFANENKEFTYAPILTHIAIYHRQGSPSINGFRMRFLIPEHARVRHSQNVSVKYF